MNDFSLKIQAILDKVKSLANIKKNIKEIEPKIPPVKLTGELNENKTKSSVNKSAKKIKPKITIDADTSKLEKTLEKTLKKKRSIKITPSVDSTEFSKTSKEIEKQSQSLFSRLTNNIAGLDITRRVLQEFVNSVKNAISNVKKLNKISTDVQMASGSTKSETDGLMSSYHGLAKEISSTTKATAENANTFIRMGESLRDTNTLIKNSQMLSKIGMIENADSADYLISSMKGYKIAAQDSVSIIDKLTSVDMAAAVSAGNLAEAMSKTANLADSSGISMDHLIGYLATVQETTQKTASVVGTSFQSMLSRMNNIKIGKFIDDETGEDLSDVEAVLGKLNIKIRDSENTYRNFDDVLKDVADRWESFNDVERNSVAVAIAGTRQRENMLALFANFDKALQLSEISANSAGTALKRYEVYQDSLEAKTNQLTNAFEGLSVNLFDDEAIAGILDATTALVEFIDKTNLLKGTLSGVATAGILSVFSSIATGAVTAAKSAAQLTSVMAMFNNGMSKRNLLDIGAACIGLSDAQLKLVLSMKGVAREERDAILRGMGLKDVQIEQKLSTLGFANAEKAAEGATFSFAGALNTLKTAFATNPIGVSIMALTTAVSVGTMVFSHYKQKQEEALRVAQDAANTYADTSKSVEDYTKRYEELHHALLEARGNEEDTYNVKKQLLDLQIELNNEYGDEYGKVNLVTDAYRDQTEAIKALNKEAANKILNDIGEAEIRDITNKMNTPQTYTLSDQYIITDSERGKALQELAQKYSNQGIKISNTTIDGLQDTFMISIEANPKDAYKTIGSFMSDVRNKANELGDEHIFDGVLEISKVSYDNTSKDIENLGKTYNEILRAQISRDDRLSAPYNNAIQAVKDYNEAVLKSENPYSDEKVESAYQNLKEIKAGIQDNEEEWGKYSAITDEVFGQADTRMLDFTSKLSSMNNNDMFKGLQNKIDIEAKALLNAGADDEYKDLIALADEYSLSIDDIISSLQNMGIVLDGIAVKSASVYTKPFSKSEMITAINQMSEGFESLDKIMSSMKGKNPFDYALLDDKNFRETFSGLGKSYTDFVEQISNSPKDVKACQNAFDSLVSEWIKSTGILDQVSDHTEGLTASMLKMMGVTNAEEVVTKALVNNHNKLAAEKYYNEQASAALEGATASEVGRIVDEGIEAGITEGALIKLVAEKIVANSTTLSTNGDIENLKALAVQAGLTADAISQFKTGADGVAGSSGAGKGRLYSNNPEKAKQDLLNSINDAVDANFGTGNTPNTSYGGGTKTNKSGTKDKSSKENSDIDWIDQRTKLLKNKQTELENQLSDTYTAYTGLSKAEIERVNDLMNTSSIPSEEAWNELIALASKADMSITELTEKVKNGTGLENKQSLLERLMQLDNEIIKNAEGSIDDYKHSYEDLVALVPEYRDKIENGGVNIELVSGNLKTQLTNAMDAYNKLYDAQQSVNEAKEKRREHKEGYLSAELDSLDAENSKLEKMNSLVDEQINYIKASGSVVDTDAYQQQIDNFERLVQNYNRLIKLAKNKRDKLDPIEDSAKYAELTEQVDDYESARIKALEAIAEKEFEVAQIPIDNLTKIIGMYNDITSTIENWGAELESSGKKLDAGYYQSLIENGTTIIDQYKEQADLIQDLMSEYDTGSDNWNELYSRLQSVNGEMSSMVQNLHKWNEELLKMPMENISSFSSELQKVVSGLNGVKGDLDTVVSAVTGAIKAQMDVLEAENSLTNDSYNERIKLLQEQLDLLEKTNTERNLQYNLEKAQFELERARNQKTTKVVREGEVTWEKDSEAERDAQKAVQDAEYDITKNHLQTEMDGLNDTLDDINEKYNDQVDALQKQSDKWSEIAEKIKQAQDELKANEFLGKGWKDKVTSGNDTDIYNMFKNLYQTNADQIQKYEEQIKSTDNIYSLLQDYITSYKEGAITYEQAQSGIKDLLSQMNGKMSATDNLQNIYDYLGTVNGTAANADAVLKGIQSALEKSSDELIKSLEQYNENAGLISEYTTSWQQLTNNVADMKDILEDVKDALEDAADRDDDRGSSSGSGSGGHWDSSDSSHGPGVAKYKKGVENGPVGKTKSKAFDTVQTLGTKTMENGEVLAIVHEGEAILNMDQQEKLIENLKAMGLERWTKTPSWLVPDYSNMNYGDDYSTTSKNTNVEINIGDVTIEECNDAKQFLEGIQKGKLRSAIIQELGKR